MRVQDSVVGALKLPLKNNEVFVTRGMLAMMVGGETIYHKNWQGEKIGEKSDVERKKCALTLV